MGDIKIEFYEEGHISHGNILGRFISSHEDTTTTTTSENVAIPSNARIVRFYSITTDHYFNMREGDTDTAATRRRVPAGQSHDYEIEREARVNNLLRYESVS